jgi:arsenite methyltransferase
VGADDARGFISLDELRPPQGLADPGDCGCGPGAAETEASGCGCAPAAGDLAAPRMREVPVEVHVKERYDQLASAGASTLCCAPAAVYTPEELAGIPSWVLELSSGCGSPLDALSLQPGQIVADFGCGAGLDLLIAARRVGPGGRVIGIDGSMPMVRAARRAAKEAGAANIDVRIGDLRRPPLRPGSVDVVLSNCVLGMFPDKQQVLSVIASTLRPGGVAVISDVVYADGTTPEEVMTAESASADDFARCVVGLTESEYSQLVTDAGFARAEFRGTGPVAYRDGASVTSATIFAYRDNQPPSESCC